GAGARSRIWRSATPAGVAAVHPTADSAGEGDGSGCFRGRPRPRLFATILPSTKISPPHTPQGSSRSSAPWRHSTRSGQVPQRDCARLRSGACSANQRSTVSRFWHGKVRSRSSVAMRTSNDVDNVAPKKRSEKVVLGCGRCTGGREKASALGDAGSRSLEEEIRERYRADSRGNFHDHRGLHANLTSSFFSVGLPAG